MREVMPQCKVKETMFLQVRKLNFLNEIQLGDFPVSHT